jgi:hypothetical protein
MVTGNKAHRKGVVDGEAERRRGSNDGEALVASDEVPVPLQLEEGKGGCEARLERWTVVARVKLTGGNGLAAALRPEIQRLEGSSVDLSGWKAEGRKGGICAAEGKRNGERKGGHGSVAILYRHTEVGGQLMGWHHTVGKG